ncbi:hypothetical protein [Methylocystis parvus]|uniref:hypothetical protein n=1 Tax=Methylocystis parvus TaxID=134 RepID=UPI003C730EBD
MSLIPGGVCSHERWSVTAYNGQVTGFASIYVYGNGQLDGLLDLSDNFGDASALTGVISKTDIYIVRHLNGVWLGKKQIFTGSYYKDGTRAGGSIKGVRPGAWEAVIIERIGGRA